MMPVLLLLLVSPAWGGFQKPSRDTHWNAYGGFPRGIFSPRAGGDAHWGYSGSIGPTHWADITGDFADCAGSQQSPVDIPTESGAFQEVYDESLGLQRLLNYNALSPGEFSNTGHSVKFGFSEPYNNHLEGSYLTGRYELLQCHFHHHSEHERDGLKPFELHLVHQHPDTLEYAVVGVMYEIGTVDDPLVAAFVSRAGVLQYEGNTTSGELDAALAMPSDRSYYTYRGSFTTPPCTEGVHWFVFKETKTVSQAQVDALSALWGGVNNRPVQPLGNRGLRYFNAMDSTTHLHTPPGSQHSTCGSTININFAGMFTGSGWSPPAPAH